MIYASAILTFQMPYDQFQFNLTMSSLRPSRATVINIVEDQLDRAAGNLDNARRLAGRTAKIPTWDMLMLAWSWYINRDDDHRDSSTQTDRERPSNKGGSSWSAEAASRWAYSLTRDELIKHPVVQVALERAVVQRKVAPKGLRPLSWAPRPFRGEVHLIDSARDLDPPPAFEDVVSGVAGLVIKPVPVRATPPLLLPPPLPPPASKGGLVKQKLPKVVMPTRWLVKKVCQMYDEQPIAENSTEPEPVNWDVKKDTESALLLHKSGPNNRAN